MNIQKIFNEKKTVFSLEIFPPKKDSSVATIYNTLDRLSDVKPDFISVTYGAGGTSTNNLTAKLASDIKTKYNIEPLAHLTCIHSSKEYTTELLTELKDKGIENILALRGDKNPDLPISEDFKYSHDLVHFIKDFGGFNIAGACYPEGHPESENLNQDILNLKYKVDAGVTHLASQLFYDNDDFYKFTEKLELAGISVPVEAGIMPVINKKQIERVVSMCGASLPVKFSHMMTRYEDNPEALFDAGIAYAVDQIVDLISNGVRGIHLYTMNNADVALKIYESIKNILDATNK